MSMLNEIGKSGKKRDETNFFVRIFKFLLPWKGDSFQDVLRKFVFIGSCVAFCYAGVLLFEYGFGSQEDNALENSILDIMTGNPDDSRDTSQNNQPSVNPDDGTYVPREILGKYQQLLEINPDTVGMIKIPGLLNPDGVCYVEYPVVQGPDNVFYAEHNFTKEPSQGGWVFADYKAILTDAYVSDNITLYGHNLASGRMFRHVNDYKSGFNTYSSVYYPEGGLEVLKAANLVQFDTLWQESDYVIFAVFVTGIYDYQDDGHLFEYFKTREITTQEEFDYFYDNVMKRSLFLSDIEVEFGEDLLTLSTCSAVFEDSRCVVVARKLRPGETAEQYIDSYTLNPDPWLPYALYETYGGMLDEPNH